MHFAKQTKGKFKDNIAIYVNQKKNSKISNYKIFTELNNLFLEIKKEVVEFGKIYYISNFHQLEPIAISISDLIKYQKEERTNIPGTEYSVYETILKIGGKELFEQIELEKKQEEKNSKGFFKENNTIKKVEISNFKLYENIEIELSESINIVIGKNGYGKSSLLQAIALGLAPTQHEEHEAKNKTYNYKKYINRNIFTKFESKLQQFSTVELNWKNFTQNHKIYSDTILSDKAEKLSFNYMILAYGSNLFTEQNINIRTIVDEIVQENGRNFSIYSILEDYTVYFYNPLTILQELTDRSPSLYPERKEEIVKKVDLLIKTLNIFLSIQEPDSYKIELYLSNETSYTRGKYYFVNEKGKWELEELSEGYRKNILLITDILLRILAAKQNILPNEIIDSTFFEKAKGTILIDEYDRHLHPVWQRKLISQLKNVFKNIQFILTTHNVFSLQSAVRENLIELSKDKKEYYLNKIEARNILGIIRKYITPEIYDTETQGLLNEFNLDLENIYKGNTHLAVSIKFKDKIAKLLKKSGEFEQIIANDLLQLNNYLEEKGLDIVEL